MCLCRPLRLVVLVVALLAAGCTDSSTTTGPESGASGGEGGGDSDPAAFNSEAPPGASAQAFLDDQQYTTLKVEVDYMTGHEPTPAALDNLTSVLEAHLDKSTIAVQAPTEIASGGRDRYTAEQIRDLEATHRDHYTQAGSETLWAYVLVVDGTFDQENVVGVAYYNTSTAFFGKTINEISGGLTQPSEEKVEATVLRHEFGHNLGLVNNGTEMQQDHQDEENGAHCTQETCVMYYAIETTDYFANVFDGQVPGFESFCTDDMAAQREQ